jgi:uncharacterized protein (DUF1330 family)
MAAYAVGLYNISDPSWRPRYREVVGQLVAKHGGRYIVRSSDPWEILEGTPPQITGLTIIEFPSMEQARAWYNDPEYAPMIRLRQTGSRLDFILVQGSTW